jgi:hypothetical protein
VTPFPADPAVLFCSKCLSTDVWRSYHKASTCGDDCAMCHATISCQGGPSEHIQWGCKACRFTWLTEVAPPAAEVPA